MTLDEEINSHDGSRNQTEETADNSEGNPSDYGSNDNNSASSRAGSLRESVQNSKNGNTSPGGTDFNSLRMEAKRRQGLKEKTNKAVEKFLSPAKKALSGMLKAAWANLISSFGTTFLWIDIHVFMNSVVGKNLFCDLGEEWVPNTSGPGGAEAAEKAGKSIGLIENMGCCCMNLGCLFSVIFSLALVAIVVGVVSNPFGSIKIIMDIFVSYFK